MKRKMFFILLLFVMLFVVSPRHVSAVVTDVPIIEEVSFTDGGATEIDTIEMSAPINIIADELLVMIMCSDNAQDAIYFNTTPSGWTKLGESGNSVCDCHIAVFYQLANGSEVDTTVIGVTVSNMLGWIIRISGVDPIDIIEDSNFAASTAAGVNPQIVPSITTLKDNALVLYGLTFDGGDGYPMTTVFPFIELSDRTNTGTPTEAYVAGTFGYRNLANKGLSGDAYIYTENVDGAAYFQLAINGNVETVDVVGSGIIYDLFYSTTISGWLGPLMLVVLSFIVLSDRKYKPLGIVFLVVETLILWSYVDLVTAEPWYWWNIIILVLGDLLCLGQMVR